MWNMTLAQRGTSETWNSRSSNASSAVYAQSVVKDVEMDLNVKLFDKYINKQIKSLTQKNNI